MASDKVILVVFGFCEVTQGINVVNTSEDDHADTDELSELHADLTCTHKQFQMINLSLFL